MREFTNKMKREEARQKSFRFLQSLYARPIVNSLISYQSRVANNPTETKYRTPKHKYILLVSLILIVHLKSRFNMQFTLNVIKCYKKFLFLLYNVIKLYIIYV